MCGALSAQPVGFSYKANTWGRMATLTVKSVIRRSLASSAPIAKGSYLARFCKRAITTTSTQPVPDAPSAATPLEMAKKCFFKEQPFGILDVDQGQMKQGLKIQFSEMKRMVHHWSVDLSTARAPAAPVEVAADASVIHQGHLRPSPDQLRMCQVGHGLPLSINCLIWAACTLPPQPTAYVDLWSQETG